MSYTKNKKNKKLTSGTKKVERTSSNHEKIVPILLHKTINKSARYGVSGYNGKIF